MIIKSGRRKLADALSKVRIESLEQRILLSAASGSVTLQFAQQPVYDKATDTVSYSLELVDESGNVITNDQTATIVTDLETVDASGNPVAMDNYGSGFVPAGTPFAWIPNAAPTFIGAELTSIGQGVERGVDANGLASVSDEPVDQTAQSASTYEVSAGSEVIVDSNGNVERTFSEPLNNGKFTYEVSAAAGYDGMELYATSNTFSVDSVIAPPAAPAPVAPAPPPVAPTPLPAPTANAPDFLYVSHNILHAVAGTPISADGQYVTVEVLKADGSVDTSYNGNINITAGSISGTLSLTAKNGSATFSDLTFGADGSDPYSDSISATDDNGDAQFAANSFAVMPAGSQPDNTPVQMVIVQQPTVDATNGTFSLKVAMLDRDGNPVANGLSVELQLFSGPEGASLSSTTGGTAVSSLVHMIGGNGPFYSVESAFVAVDANGYATFTGLAVNITGTYVVALGNATPTGLLLTDPFQIVARAAGNGAGPSEASARFAAASPLPSALAGDDALSKGKTTVASEVLDAGPASGGVLSILNSPFSAASGNPLLS